MGRTEAQLGTLAFFFIAPGTAGGLVPWLITHWRMGEGTSIGALIIGSVMIAAGLAGLIECFSRFARKGGGTPAPIAPTQHLVVTGLYRFVRNPMYVSVLVLVFGQMLVFSSAALLAYGVALWTAFHIFVVFFEEQRLQRDFGDEYLAYCANVPRWIPRILPWRPEAAAPNK
jgi:protein-S-isoprenylcysteine O-methyltransferase Ste14